MTADPASHDGFLPLADAAARLGISRLKLREAVAKGVVATRRDNQGRLRVDLSALPDDIEARTARVPADASALMAALFDEIEELSADLEDARGQAGTLAGLVAAQGAVLERAATTLEQAVADRERFAALSARALEVATVAEARATALQSTTERAFGLLDRSAAALERAEGDTADLRARLAEKEGVLAGQTAQLDRLFTLSEQALQAAAEARRAPGLVARMFGGPRNKS